MKFSIIICTYNAVERLSKTLDSILAQTFNDWEIIIIDGASTDGTTEIIRQYEERIGMKMRWISEQDTGIYNAMNKGVVMASGIYLNVVGAGDWLEKDALEKANDCMMANFQADAVHGRLRVWDKELRNSYLLQSFPKELIGKPMQHPALYYKKSLHDDYGLYSENYKIVSDYLFCMKAFLRGGATAVPFDCIVDNYVTDGISSTEMDKCEAEKMIARQELGLNPLVSIIMPSYNQELYILEALNSIKAQTYPNWECVILDDGSTDKTSSIVKLFIEKDKRFRYIWQENQGPSAARNNAILHSYGEYILPLDSDDIISPLYLQDAVSAFLWNPSIKLIYCNAEYFGNRNGKWKLPDYSYDRILFYNMIFCSAVYRRSDYNKTSGYNINMSYGLEDWDFWLSFINRDDFVYKIPETHFHYRIKKSSHNADLHRDDIALQKMYEQIFLNHKEKYQGVINPVCIEKYMSEVKKCVRLVIKEMDDRSFIDKAGNFLQQIFFKIFFAIFSPIKFGRKYFDKLLNSRLRHPMRKIWYFIRGRKI